MIGRYGSRRKGEGESEAEDESREREIGGGSDIHLVYSALLWRHVLLLILESVFKTAPILRQVIP